MGGTFDLAKLDVELAKIQKQVDAIELNLAKSAEKKPEKEEIFRKLEDLRRKIFDDFLPMDDLKRMMGERIQEKLQGKTDTKLEERQRLLDKARKVRERGGINPFQEKDEAVLQEEIHSAFREQVENELLKTIERINKSEGANDELLRWAKRNMGRQLGSMRGEGVRALLMETVDNVLAGDKISSEDPRRMNLFALKASLERMR